MSKPNLLAFSTSIGFFRNKRVREARTILLLKLKRQVHLAEATPQLFATLMAYCGENQIDGDFSSYSPEQLHEVFTTNHQVLSLSETKLVIQAFHDVGLMEDGKIRSWKKYNRHLAEYEKDKKAKVKAGKERQKQRAAQTSAPGKPHHEYLGSPEEQREASSVSKVPANKVRWNGKDWPVTALQDQLRDMEKQRDVLLKKKPSLTANTGNGDESVSHNVCLLWQTEINRLEEGIASIRTALQGSPVRPLVHSIKSKSKLVTTRRATLSVDELDEADVEKELAELRESIDGIQNPPEIGRSVYYDGDRLKPTAEKDLQQLRRREGELSRRLTAIAGDFATA